MADLVGQQLGNYRLVRSLGRGGYAQVYLGEHIRLNTQAAIKVLHTRLATDEEVNSFQNDEVLLSDFGTALVAQSTALQTTPEEVIGTVSYMAPEQFQGKARPASDQYALAVVVYEWLSGALPFRGSGTEVAIQHSMAPLPSLREKVPTIPPQVEQVIMRALAKDYHQRFPRVQDFADALEQTSKKVSIMMNTFFTTY